MVPSETVLSSYSSLRRLSSSRISVTGLESPGTVRAAGADRRACRAVGSRERRLCLLRLGSSDLCVFYLFSVSLKFSVFFVLFPIYSPFCSMFNCSCPSLWISVSQTPLQLSRCYDKPWLTNSKAGSHVKDSHCPDLQLLSPEVEYGFAE